MGAVDIESIDTSKADSGEVSGTAVVLDETPKAEPTGKSSEVGEKSSEKSTEKVVKKEVKTKETSPEPFLKVGEKPYTKEQVMEYVEKAGRYQSDRDKSEAAVEKVLRQLQQAGYTVDNSWNVVPTQRQNPQPTREELTLLAAAGDNEALNKLLEIHGNEVANKVFTGIQQAESSKGIIEKMKKEYPDFYGPDGQPNLESPLAKEAARILEANPELGNIKYLPFIAQAAEANLIKGNLKNFEQTIKDKTHQKLAQSASQSLGTPGSVQKDESGEFSDEQVAAASKFGIAPDRLAKLIKRTSERGGINL